MSFSIRGKAAVITGGGSGIGLAIARRFCEHGAQVMVVDRADDKRSAARGIGALFHCADVSVEADVAGAFAAACDAFGKVDILVNNAGIQPLGLKLDDLTGPILDRTFAVNVNGVAFGLKHAGRVMADGGRVINLASFVGMIGVPGGTAYAASKAAVIHLTKLGAIELAPRGITVNAISPGTILTPAVTGIADNPEIPFIERRTPLGRLATAEEVAALCHYLASEEAACLTGQNIALDGGLTAGWMHYDLVPPANVRQGRWIDDL